MRENVHPLSTELLAALRDPGHAATSTYEHVEHCVACRIRMLRIQHDVGAVSPGQDSIQRIIDASSRLPDTVTDLISRDNNTEPQANELWRVGRTEALLVWVRKVFDDGIADVVPVVLDTELADLHTLIIGAPATPLSVELAVMVPLRTHIPTRLFLNKIAAVDIGTDVDEVMAAMREGRNPSGVQVGSPVDDENDQRIEYRQAMRDLLAELAPGAAEGAQEEPEGEGRPLPAVNEGSSDDPPDDLQNVQAELNSRLSGVRCVSVSPTVLHVNDSVRIKRVLKIFYLDTTVLLLILLPESVVEFPNYGDLAEACRTITLIDTDVDAVTVTLTDRDTSTLLFTSADMRSAVGIPDGNQVGPSPTLVGLGLIDTLCKHLDSSVAAWELTDQEADNFRIHTNLTAIASRHAAHAAARIGTEGNRARQQAKKSAWLSLDKSFDEQATGFVTSIIGDGDVEAALARLGLEGNDD
ncbi:hypothetical protein ACQPZ2_30890 [Nocardia pseudovaccinii]|uniref:hypothetical protein n=1 Tax=Nocardia pseudovaccinii TaxID=189540 RepID=UPI003D8B6C0A